VNQMAIHPIDKGIRQIRRKLQSAQGLELIIEALPVAVLVVDDKGMVILGNSKVETIFGYRPDELIGHPVELLVPERFHFTQAGTRARFFEGPAREMGVNRNLIGRRKDNSEFPVDIALSTIQTTEGICIISAIVDMTSAKQLEGRFLRMHEIEVQESERRRLARELHDEIGQLLSAVSVDLQAAKVACEPAAATRLEDSIALVDKAVEQVRDLTLDLRPPMLDDLGLIATLRWYADREAQRAGLVSHFVIKSAGTRLASECATACYRVVQEAVTNVIRHARARQVWIEFHEEAKEVRLTVRDDGVGFNPDLIESRASGNVRFGLLGMKERVELLGGRIEVKSLPDQGATIEAWIPLPVLDPQGRCSENEFNPYSVG
jgi:PAS domain S-box-containing protein